MQDPAVLEGFAPESTFYEARAAPISHLLRRLPIDGMLSAKHTGRGIAVYGDASKTRGSGPAITPGRPIGHVLIVEPEELVRWSLVTYLAQWFDVFAAESRALADRILEDQQFDAVVVSDDLSDRSAECLAARALSLNPAARVVLTITDPKDTKVRDRRTPCLEKPFELSVLASLLGVTGDGPAREQRERTGEGHP